MLFFSKKLNRFILKKLISKVFGAFYFYLIIFYLIMGCLSFGITNIYADSTCSLPPPQSGPQASKDNVKTQQTLPQNLTYNQLNQYVAEELNWIPEKISNNLCGGYFAEPETIRTYPHPLGAESQSTFITASGPTVFVANGVSILNTNVIVSQLGRLAKADRAYVYHDAKMNRINKIILVGHVELREFEKVIIADRATLTLYPKEAVFINSAYHTVGSMKYSFNAWGVAKHTFRDAQKVLYLKHATYSTCNPLHPTWTITANRLVLDREKNKGKAFGAVIRVKSIPVLYLPYYSFVLKPERKSGFLTPLYGHDTFYGSTKTSESNFGLPYYFNLAPNYDLLFTPEYYTLRKTRFSNYFRYLTPRSIGDLYLSVLPDDQAFGTYRTDAIATYSNTALYPATTYQPYLNELKRLENDREFVFLTSTTNFDPDNRLKLDVNYVNDPYYFRDIHDNNQTIATTTSNQLLNRLDWDYKTDHWNFNAISQAYETLHIIDQTVTVPLDQYKLLPDIGFDGYYPDFLPYTDLNWQNDISNFDYASDFTPNRPMGQRLHLRPGFSTPIETSIVTITPSIWLDAVGYNTVHQQPPQTSTPDRILPIIDIDNQFYFDRILPWQNEAYIATLEPRLFYLYVPYQNQNALPNFDTVLLPFFYDQLFSINTFTGFDRLENANQISLGLTSRLLRSDSGGPLISASLGLAYYADEPRVCLGNSCTNPAEDRLSPIASNVTVNISPNWSLVGNIAYDTELREVNNDSISLHYGSDPGHIIQIGYTYVHPNILSIVPGINSIPSSALSPASSNITLAATWPLLYHWIPISAVAYGNYNIGVGRLDTYYAGLRYDACCWAVRLVMQRSYLSTTTNNQGKLVNNYDNQYYVQLVFKGLGDFGTGNINQLLTSTIPGIST